MEKISLSLEGKIDWTPTDHTQCNLGKWYYSKGKEEIKMYDQQAVEIFNSIEEPHARLHTIGISAIRKAKEKEAKEAIELAKKMYRESKEIIDKLFQLYNVVSINVNAGETR
ncbi:CZB domain-containing protein [Persephonella hydrogeniphila]